MFTASKFLTHDDHPTEMPESEGLAALAAACQKGNREAQQQLYERCQDRVYRLLLRVVGRQDAADVMQQVFLHVFRFLDQFEGLSRFETWLYRIAINEAFQHLRRERKWRWTSLVKDQMDHSPDQERRLDYKELFEQAIARLDPDLRALFLLREVDHLSYSEISEVTQLPEGTVASRLNRARQLLKQHLIELGWEQ